ncbi:MULTISPECIES: tetraacyldisaccharide 4'-kinase [Eikenella]|uniref:tetraacyldisaccharide 4'-kinase n=1 Tax=Eikenella TaxID=538 RepID=UPI0007D09ACB|nr:MULTISPECIES: tetraacyldisaccharide 4'-kinase [Eikenella]OAM15091.1 tetraacyldisaccharide 4'-kinase [Eikenella corrodens]OFN58217.1 tetraacyldisaccharide 4'-kinase [Eikenella sp. HMSC061C02]OWP24412.1 tetraacyldisaccharide 4'-kinase [Eikenella corrodens]
MLHRLIERHWQTPNPLLTPILWPLARLFGLLAARRREGYLKGQRHSEKLPVPVVVVGNVQAGGSGKTPVVQALVRALQERGIRPGIISRGYGRSGQGVHVLNNQSTAAQAGDEPLLLHRSTGAPAAVGSRRAEAGRALLAEHPEVQIIVADDGLQHYALQRDFELAVFPAADVGRPLDLLPNGNLREPLQRLESVNAVLLANSTPDRPEPDWALPDNVLLCRSRLQCGQIYRLHRPHEPLPEGYLKQRSVIAAAAIAKPERFFAELARLGIETERQMALPDHAAWQIADLPAADCYIVTEKDAVKLAADTAQEVWVLPVRAELPEALVQAVIRRCLPDREQAT